MHYQKLGGLPDKPRPSLSDFLASLCTQLSPPTCSAPVTSSNDIRTSHPHTFCIKKATKATPAATLCDDVALVLQPAGMLLPASQAHTSEGRVIGPGHLRLVTLVRTHLYFLEPSLFWAHPPNSHPPGNRSHCPRVFCLLKLCQPSTGQAVLIRLGVRLPCEQPAGMTGGSHWLNDPAPSHGGVNATLSPSVSQWDEAPAAQVVEAAGALPSSL